MRRNVCTGYHQNADAYSTLDYLVELLIRYSKNRSARSIVSARTLDKTQSHPTICSRNNLSPVAEMLQCRVQEEPENILKGKNYQGYKRKLIHSLTLADRSSSDFYKLILTGVLFFFFVLFPYLDPANLAADGLGQFVHELDYPRVFIGRGDFLHVGLQLMRQFFPCDVPLG
jgi:hypothetical protein